MAYEIKNRSGAVLFESKTATTLSAALVEAAKTNADLRGADLRGADLEGADLEGADLRGAYLRGAYLGGADLRGADLGGADLGGADLGGADLRGAYLGGADLRGADLEGADLGGQWIVQGGHRSDGYSFFLQKLTADTEPMIKAGCRYFTITDARKHWNDTRANTPLGDETTVLIDAMIAVAKIRKLID